MLGKFPLKDKEILKEKSNVILNIITELIINDIESAMNKFN